VVFLSEVFEEVSPSSELKSLPVERFRTRLRGLEGERDLVRVTVQKLAPASAGRRRPA
jgi:hypothetical protein